MEENKIVEQDDDSLRSAVRDHYGTIAKGGCGCGSGGQCCSQSSNTGVSNTVGYNNADLESLPDGADMGLGCGNPHAIAALKAGESVLDLGSGGGIDCFLAAKQVGAQGRVIGVDMTPDMVSKARRLAKSGGYTNVEFRLGEIEHLPVADSSIDVILSNCVVNLSPDKPEVFREAYRVLKRGGRLAISDMVALGEIPVQLKVNLDAVSSCVSGSAPLDSIKAMLKDAGFSEIKININEGSRDFVSESFPEAVGIVASANIEAYKK